MNSALLYDSALKLSIVVAEFVVTLVDVISETLLDPPTIVFLVTLVTTFVEAASVAVALSLTIPSLISLDIVIGIAGEPISVLPYWLVKTVDPS